MYLSCKEWHLEYVLGAGDAVHELAEHRRVRLGDVTDVGHVTVRLGLDEDGAFARQVDGQLPLAADRQPAGERVVVNEHLRQRLLQHATGAAAVVAASRPEAVHGLHDDGDVLVQVGEVVGTLRRLRRRRHQRRLPLLLDAKLEHALRASGQGTKMEEAPCKRWREFDEQAG